jgi:hypothetical protein
MRLSEPYSAISAMKKKLAINSAKRGDQYSTKFAISVACVAIAAAILVVRVEVA